VALAAVVPAPFVPPPFVPAPFMCAGSAVPFPFARPRLGGEPSAPSLASGGTRRVPVRAGRAAGTISAGRSARVRGATIVREV
jgi:hypothetical protein